MTHADSPPATAPIPSIAPASLTPLREIAGALALAQTTAEAAETALAHITPLATADGACVSLLTADGLNLELLHAHGLPDEEVAGWQLLPIDSPLPPAQATRSGTPVVAGTLLSIPLVFGKGAVGAITLRFERGCDLLPDQIGLLHLIGYGAAATLQRMRLLDQEREARRALELQREELNETVNALSQSQRRFQQLLETSPDAILIHRSNRIVFANAALLQLLGATSEEELMRLDALDIVHETGREAVRLLDTPGRNEPREIAIRRFDGVTIPVEATSATCEWRGEPAIQVLFRDMSERREAARKLHEEERRFSFLVELLPLFVWSAGPNGCPDYWNQQLLRYVGKTREEMKGWSWGDVVHPDECERCQKAWDEAFASGTGYQMEFRLREAHTGEYRWFHGHALPLRDEQGTIIRWYGTCMDIHERKVSEQAVRVGQERLEAALRAGGMGAWDWDLRSGRVMWEGNHAHLLGLGQDEFDGKLERFERCIHPDDRARTLAAVTTALEHQERFQHQFRVRWKNGEIHWIEGHGQFFFDGSGAATRMVGTIQCIDDRVAAEAYLARQNEQQQILTEAATLLLENDDPASIVQAIYDRVARHLNAEIYFNYAVTDDGRQLRLVLNSGMPSGTCAYPTLRFGQGPCGTVAQTGQPLVANNVQNNDDPTLAWLRSWGGKCYCGLPLNINGKVVGTLAFASCSKPAFTPDDVKLLHAISQYVAIAQERQRFLTKLRGRAAELGLFLNAQREIAQTEPRLEARLKILVPKAQEIVQGTGAAVALVEGDELVYRVASGSLADCLGLRLPAERSLVGRAAREAVPLRSDDTEIDPRADREACRRFNARSMLVVPLIYNSKAVGVLAVSSDRPEAFTDEHLAITEEMSSIVVVAISTVEVAEAKQALSTVEERLRLALEGATIGVWSWEAATDSFYASPELGALLGEAPAAPLSRQRMLEAIQADDHEEYRVIVGKALAAHTPYESEHRIARPGQSERWISERGRGIFAENGELLGIEGVVLDITERRELQAQLLQAQKMEGIGRLAGGIAHDFNNLLAVVLGYAEILEMELDAGSPLLSSVHSIKTAATRAATLTKQLLAFARRQTTDLKTVQLNDVLRNMGEMLSPLINEQITLHRTLAADLGPVKADPNQIEQVVLNLVVNALDAMPAGGTLSLSTENATVGATTRTSAAVAPGNYAVISVSDTGQGISEELKARVFEPFFSTKPVGKGTGLGLATCYGIVKQHRGYILIDSQAGQGTTVRVYLPRANGMAEAAAVAAANDALPGGNETVLVVEDEALVRELTVTTLRAQGYHVLSAQNGETALQVAAAHAGPIHLLLSDMAMPQMGGPELAQQLKALRPETRVLFVSGYSEEALHVNATGRNRAPLLPKPYAARTLLTKIREVLD